MALSALLDSSLSEIRTGVLEVPPPELKATVVGVGESYHQIARNLCMLIIRIVNENKAVAPTVPFKDVSTPVARERRFCPIFYYTTLLTLWGTK